MAKISITKPTGGVESLSLLSAFKAEGNSYVILDSERLGSMGLPIIYVCKYTTKLEKITDDNEWQSVKNHLKGIINGSVFEYFKIENNLSADEVFYTPLTLPQASYDAIKGKYITTETVEPMVESSPVPTISVQPLTPPTHEQAAVNNSMPQVDPIVMPSVEPVIPNNNVSSNSEINSTILNMPSVAEPVFEVKPIEEAAAVTPTQSIDEQTTSNINNTKNNFENDKETFIKACENMFDALVSKYEKKLADIERREEELIKKEKEIAAKMQNASEHLANAEARETVANIAHDNAKKVMDISSMMPVNPNATEAGVI